MPDDWPRAQIGAVVETAENDPEINVSLDIFSTIVSIRASSLIDSVHHVGFLVRITAFVMIWLASVKGTLWKPVPREITVVELHAARERLLRLEQFVLFRKEIDYLRAGRAPPSDSALLPL